MQARGFVVTAALVVVLAGADPAALAGDAGTPTPTPGATWSEIPGPGLEPEDADFGVGAIIALAGIILLVAVVASVRALRKRSAPVD